MRKDLSKMSGIRGIWFSLWRLLMRWFDGYEETGMVYDSESKQMDRVRTIPFFSCTLRFSRFFGLAGVQWPFRLLFCCMSHACLRLRGFTIAIFHIDHFGPLDGCSSCLRLLGPLRRNEVHCGGRPITVFIIPVLTNQQMYILLSTTVCGGVIWAGS